MVGVGITAFCLLTALALILEVFKAFGKYFKDEKK